jgi:hypothetical protein
MILDKNSNAYKIQNNIEPYVSEEDRVRINEYKNRLRLILT